ncbi:MAG: sulfatase-like hydrolase/transferase [Zavarzinella sp.]
MSIRLLLVLLFFCHPALNAEKPNIVLIMADDLGYECLGVNGGEYRTPNLDQLAKSGNRYTNCHVQPLCTPTRVQLMTGLWNVRNYRQFGYLDPKSTTFAHHFQKNGYRTAIAGKWQLGQGKDLPQKLGFEESYLWQHTRRPPRYANPGLEWNGKALDFSNGEYGPDLINKFACDFVRSSKDKPFMLYYPMVLTHDPFQPTPDSPKWDPKAVGESVNRNVKNFSYMVSYMDKLVGNLVKSIKETGKEKNTLIIFIGDNGTHPTITTMFNGKPYQGGKGKGTAAGTHVPCVVSWPGVIASGVQDQIVCSCDFFPTMLEIAGLKVPEGLDGMSFAHQLIGKPGKDRTWWYCWYARNGGKNAQVEFVGTKDYKVYQDGRLFRLKSDPLEQNAIKDNELTTAEKAIKMQLAGQLEQYRNARPEEITKPLPKMKKN